MFQPDPTAFPGNVITALIPHLESLDSEVKVLRRPIAGTDPTQTISIVPANYDPDPQSEEMRGRIGGLTGPTLAGYLIFIQTFNLDMNQERGLATMSAMATAVRVKLSRDMDVRVSLSLLESEALDFTERFTRHSITTQRYMSTEVGKSFMFLSNTELLIETEVS